MDGPEFALVRRLGGAHQLVGRAAQEIAAWLILERPTAGRVLSNGDLKSAADIALVRLAQHISELIDGQIFAQMGAQIDDT